jgi:hypothetical protein
MRNSILILRYLSGARPVYCLRELARVGQYPGRFDRARSLLLVDVAMNLLEYPTVRRITCPAFSDDVGFNPFNLASTAVSTPFREPMLSKVSPFWTVYS